MTVAELEARITMRELAEWVAVSRLERDEREERERTQRVAYNAEQNRSR